MLVKLLQWWAFRSRVECISGHGDPDSVYLVRFHLINNRFFKFYLHYFLRSDPDTPHDHPWDFWTYMFKGWYVEDLYDWRTRSFAITQRSVANKRFIRRKAADIHRIRIPGEQYTMLNYKEAPMTLFFALGKYREWGFVNDYDTAPRWEHHTSYLKRVNK